MPRKSVAIPAQPFSCQSIRFRRYFGACRCYRRATMPFTPATICDGMGLWDEHTPPRIASRRRDTPYAGCLLPGFTVVRAVYIHIFGEWRFCRVRMLLERAFSMTRRRQVLPLLDFRFAFCRAREAADRDADSRFACFCAIADYFARHAARHHIDDALDIIYIHAD